MNKKAYYGQFGGQYVAESLMNTLQELDQAYEEAIHDPEFMKQYHYYLKQYVGRETPLYYAERLSAKYGTKIYLKREDLNHTGAHKINNVIGQILLAKRMGKTKVIAETGAGQHGVATATGAALFDMERYITVVVLFCASGFGIYGVLVEGMSGSPAVLQSKAVLDLCTAAVFAVTLGVAVAVIALPMLAVMLALFFAAGAIAPFVTPEMLQDFISCGGVLTIVAGMRVSGIKQYPIANMIPALLLVLPASAIWQTLMV